MRFACERVSGAAFSRSRAGALGLGFEVVVRAHARDQAHLHRFGGGHTPAGHQQIARERDADVRREERTQVHVDHAAQRLGRTEHGAFARHADVGAHRDDEAAALADPVHARDHGLQASAERLEREDVDATEEGLDPERAVLMTAAHLAAGNEHVSGAREHETVQLGIRVHPVDTRA